MKNESLTVAVSGFVILAIAMGIGRFAFTPLLPMMENENLISVSSGGLLATIHFIGYLVGALVAGGFRKWPSFTLYGATVLIALSTIFMGLTNNYATWAVARWLAGFCSALVLVTVSAHFIKSLAQEGSGWLQGLVFSGVGGGILIAGLSALVFDLQNATSQLAWIIFGSVSLFLALGVFAKIGTSFSQEETTKRMAPESCASLKWEIIIPYGAMGLGYIIPATYLPIMARNAVQSELPYGLGWPVFGFTAAISTLMIVGFQSMFTNRQVWKYSQVMMAAGLIAPALFSGIGFVVLAAVCVGGTFMVITMVGMKEAHRLAGKKNPQVLIAALTASFATGQIIGPALAGWVYELTNNFTLPLLMASGVLILSLAPIWKEETKT